MLEFITWENEQWLWLKQKIQGNLQIFDAEELPPTCAPQTARFGFQFTPQTAYTLFIDKGIAYSGDNREFRDFLTNGEKGFREFEDMMAYVVGLRPLYDQPSERAATAEEPVCLEPQIGSLYDKSMITEPAKDEAQVFVESENLYLSLTDRIKGQDDVMRALAEATQIHLAQIEPQRPATIFMAGPTGTGKTESAKVLVKAINANSASSFRLLKINCNQYKESHRVSQLLGSPNGYVGYGDPPVIAPLAEHPRTVVIWDEIEKAHNDVYDVIMDAMESGVIQLPTAINGSYDVDCRQAIFIFTSNLPVYETARARLGFYEDGSETTDDAVELCKRRMVEQGMRPEIVSRIQTVLIYKSLDASVIADIIALAIVDCARAFGMNVHNIDTRIIQALLSNNSAGFGARTFKHEIQRKLGKTFARACRTFKNRPVKVVGTLDDSEIEVWEEENA